MRLLRMLGADRNELRALRRVLNRLERDGRVERSENGWRVPRGRTACSKPSSLRVRVDARRARRSRPRAPHRRCGRRRRRATAC
jgi:hypothetical protein